MPDMPDPNILYVWFNKSTHHFAGGSGAGPSCHVNSVSGGLLGPTPPAGSVLCKRCVRSQQDANRGR